MALVGGVGFVPLRLRVKASWDTGPKPEPAPKPSFPSSFSFNNIHKFSLNKLTSPPTETVKRKKKKKKKKKSKPIDVTKIMKSDHPSTTKQEKIEKEEDKSYLGHERWLPTPPKVKNPRSIYNAATLAYMGDCIFELYARRQFLFPPLNIDEHNERVMAVVRCEAQDALLTNLLSEDYLSEDERDILRWGKNIDSGKTRTVKRAGVAVYNRASSLETLVGYLYMTNVNRLDDLMLKLGFSSVASMPMTEGES